MKSSNHIDINMFFRKIYGDRYVSFKRVYTVPDSVGSQAKTVIIDARLAITKSFPLHELLFGFFRDMWGVPMRYMTEPDIESGESYLHITSYTGDGVQMTEGWDVGLAGFILETLFDINRVIELHKFNTYVSLQKGRSLMIATAVIWMINTTIIFVSRIHDPAILFSRMIFLTSVLLFVFVIALLDYTGKKEMLCHIPDLD